MTSGSGPVREVDPGFDASQLARVTHALMDAGNPLNGEVLNRVLGALEMMLHAAADPDTVVAREHVDSFARSVWDAVPDEAKSMFCELVWELEDDRS